MSRHSPRGAQYRKLINSTRWTRLRRQYLSTHPLCEDCLLQGRSTLAQEVHHVRPIESVSGSPALMQELAYNVSNLRALCRPCHVQAHVELMKGTKQEGRKRRAQELDAFARRFLGGGIHTEEETQEK